VQTVTIFAISRSLKNWQLIFMIKESNMSLMETGGGRVSVVMCTYNGKKFIEEQINSILNQTYPLSELVIVDDCSSDTTLDIVERMAKEHKIIKLYRNIINLGYNKCFEKALQLASFELIAISDQDDVWHPQKIEVLMQKWKNNALLVYCDSVRFKEKVPNHPRPNRIIKRIDGCNPRKLAVYNTVSGHAMMIKKELLTLALPFDENVYYDWWLAVVAMANGGVVHVPSILVYQREHQNNASIKKGLTNVQRFEQDKRMLIPHLQKFQTIANLQKDHLIFFKRLHELWSQSVQKKNNWKLFLFLMKNRRSVFDYKNRKFGFVSHLKHSFRYSFRRIKVQNAGRENK
jgi:glycosyltransferase involved in cell wall biosynthesis